MYRLILTNSIHAVGTLIIAPWDMVINTAELLAALRDTFMLYMCRLGIMPSCTPVAVPK
jgi:hypothetical protein